MKALRNPHRLLVTIVVLAAILAADAISAASVTHTVKIQRIHPLSDGAVVFTFETDAPTCVQSGTVDYYYVRVGENSVTQEALKNMLAVALAAATTGRAVTIIFDDSTAYCYVKSLYVRFDL